jgi:hypothetical protein
LQGEASIWTRLGPALVCAVVLVAHGPSIWGDFVWDDAYTVRDNARIRELSNAPSFFTESWGAGAPENSHAYKKNRGLYRPLTLCSFALNHAISGLSPSAFHLTNLLLHLISGILLFIVARTFISAPLAGMVALIWAAHPVHTEAVAVLSYRTTLLAGLCVLGALWCQVCADSRMTVLAGRALLFACACLCKEDAIILVAILPLHDLWIRKIPMKVVCIRGLPLLGIAAGYLAIRAAVVTASPFSFFGDMGFGEKISALLQIFWMYTRLLILPFPLTPFYDWGALELGDTIVSFNAIAGAAMAALLVGISCTWKKKPSHAFLAAGVILSMIPYSHLLPFTVGAAERFLYVPSLFACILVGAATRDFLGSGNTTPFLERLGIALLTSWVIIAISWSSFRHTQWHSNRSILKATTVFFPESFNAWKALGDTCRDEGDLEDAVKYYATAQDVAAYPIAAYLEASTLLDLGRVLEARMRLDDFLQRHPKLGAIDPQGMAMLADLVDDLNQRLRR